MSEFTAKDVQNSSSLWSRNDGCQKALDESAGDFDAALQSCARIAKADSRSDRESAEGAIAVAQSETAVLVELKSETDLRRRPATSFH